jgi:sugar/nucleoside kinase (ribokinase family)
VMTNGADATHVADRGSGARLRIEPPRLDGRLFTLGAGDVFAGTVSFILGQARGMVSGTALRAAVTFGHEVAAAHITGDPARKEQIQVLYRDEVRGLFAPVEATPQPEPSEAQEDRRAA